jgi:hypothetical protein
MWRCWSRGRQWGRGVREGSRHVAAGMQDEVDDNDTVPTLDQHDQTVPDCVYQLWVSWETLYQCGACK